MTSLNLNTPLTDAAVKHAKENPLPGNEDATRARVLVENNVGVVVVERTWRNGWGASAWFAKSKQGPASGGFDVTRR